MGVPELEGIRAKIARADIHISELNQFSARILDPLETSISSQYDLSAGQHVWTVNVTSDIPEIPIEFNIVAGEAIQQLRSSLDHLICRLANKVSGVTNYAGLAFPILENAINDKGKPTFPPSKIKVIGRAALAEVEALQPYQRAMKAQHHPLMVLNKLCNTDKHRMILVALAGVRANSVVAGPDTVFGQGLIGFSSHPGTIKLEDGAEIWRLKAGPNVEMDVQYAPLIAFDEVGFSKLKGVIPRIKKLRGEVARIIDRFEQQFF